ncbi:MAG: DUF4097 family beta strand repeat-containing protein [Euryarchaeota archaeon]|nr:DUF4097 family beta strand repeat-containing protein [Euryarchaeota archaeon]
MLKKLSVICILLSSMMLSGCTVRTEDGELYINTDEGETEIYHFMEEQALAKEKFHASVGVGDVDIAVSDSSLYDITTIVRDEKNNSSEIPKINEMGNTVEFSAPVGDIDGTISSTFDTVKFEMGIGDAKFLLNSGRFKKIDISVDIGSLKLFLPREGNGKVEIEVDTGNVEIILDKDAGYILHYDIDIGAVSIDAENAMIKKNTYRIRPEKDVAYEIWVSVDIGGIEVRG